MLARLCQRKIAVIESKNEQGGREASVVAIVKAVVNGKPVVAPIYITSSSNHNGRRYDTNAVSTVFRKKNGIRLLTDAINSPNGVGVYYINKTEAQNLYAGSEVQFPGSSLQDGLNHSIFDAGSPVNRNYLEQTETRQFKRWFEKSKVVDEDGKPLVVYHGTDADFDVFDMAKGRSTMDIHICRGGTR